MGKVKIDENIVRVDALDKASGRTQYIADLEFDGMLYVKMIRSAIARGIIERIQIPDLPDGYYFVSADDIPPEGKNELWMISKDWKAFADKQVNFIGETIALLCGPDRNVLDKLVPQISITYKEQEAATTIDESLALKGGPIVGDKNSFFDLDLRKNCDNIDEIFAKADKVIEGTYETGYQEHVHLDTNGAIVVPENGKYYVYASAQCPFYIRKSIAGCAGLKPEDIIVRQVATGGAFGGKEHFPDVLCGPLLIAAKKTGKPVKLIFSREEDTQFSVKRHPSKTIIKTAHDKDGNILAMDAEIYYNAGAYSTSSSVVIQRGVFHINGCYTFPVQHAFGRACVTNCFPSCAFRGFGAPQTIYAIERHMCRCAIAYKKDPLEYKSKYLMKQGDITSTNGHIIEKVVLPEMMKQVVDASDYWRKAKEYKYGSGKGIGISFYNHGGAFTGNGEQAIIKAHAILKRTGEKEVEMLCGQTEMGQGLITTEKKIVASILGLDMDQVIYKNPDTSRVPDSGPTAASRSTMVVGRLFEKAALEMKSRWNEGVGLTIEKAYEHPEGYPWDQSTFQGDAYLGYGWGVCVVEVEVDMLTAEPKVKGIWCSHDVGHAIDELIVRGQTNGGIVQGIGWASIEKLDCVNGKFKQKSMSDYIIPSAMEYPTMQTFLVDNPYPWGPSGAKGMGELVFNGSGAAYIDAVSRAIGKQIDKIPVPCEDLMEVMLHGENCY